MTVSSIAGTPIKGYAEFDCARRRWEKQMEQMLMEMSFVFTDNGLATYFDPTPMLDRYQADVTALEKALTDGVVRAGMRVHAN